MILRLTRLAKALVRTMVMALMVILLQIMAVDKLQPISRQQSKTIG
jgi:hypothetical protein